MKDLHQVSRRQFITWSIGAASLAVSAGTAIISHPRSAKATETITLPLPYIDEEGYPILSVELARQYAYHHYYNGGCMHGSASGLMQAFQEGFRDKDMSTGWDLLPYGMYKYGSGGVSGWGTLCGILNGCMAILNLIGLHGALGDKLMGWYSTTLFPTNDCERFGCVANKDKEVPIEPIPDVQVLAHTVSESPLCHISISKWCKAAGINVADTSPSGIKYKDDRCSKICADAAAKTAELINEWTTYQKLSEPFTVPTQYSGCLDCHSSLKDQVGKMDCLGCHVPTEVVKVSYAHPRKGRY